MIRDHALYATIGLLLGFIAGYLAHEAMAARQPPPAWGGAAIAQAAPQVAPPGGGGPLPQAGGTGTAPVAGGGAAAGMEEVQRLSAYVAENPDDADAVRLLGNLNYDIQNWGRAAELYERYLALRPGDSDVMTDLGVAYRNLGRPQDALAQFRGARATRDDHWQSRFNEVIVLAFDLQDLDAAWTTAQELQRLQPANPQVERLVSEVERRRGGA